MIQLKGVYPISGEDPTALPVKDLAAAIGFYERILGFSLVERNASRAVVNRDGVRIGVIHQETHEPGKAGSLAFAVNDLEAMHRELQERGGAPGEFGVDQWGGKRYRTFFLREAENGYCFCFHCPLSEG